MPRIVDGDNVLGTWPGRKRSDADRRLLAHEVARLARRRSRRIVLVFDGPAPPQQRLGRDVHFSGHGRKADALILELLGAEADPRGWIAVTDDRPLADQCRYLGARVERCAQLRAELTGSDGGDKPETEEDTEYWLSVFGDDGDDTGA